MLSIAPLLSYPEFFSTTATPIDNANHGQNRFTCRSTSNEKFTSAMASAFSTNEWFRFCQTRQFDPATTTGNHAYCSWWKISHTSIIKSKIFQWFLVLHRSQQRDGKRTNSAQQSWKKSSKIYTFHRWFRASIPIPISLKSLAKTSSQKSRLLSTSIVSTSPTRTATKAVSVDLKTSEVVRPAVPRDLNRDPQSRSNTLQTRWLAVCASETRSAQCRGVSPRVE